MRSENLFKCFCESRKTLYYFAKNLDDQNLNEEERELLYEIIKDSQMIANKIQDFCRLDN